MNENDEIKEEADKCDIAHYLARIEAERLISLLSVHRTVSYLQDDSRLVGESEE